MTTFKLADLPRWAAEKSELLNVVTQQSTNNLVLKASQTAAGVTRGGTVQRGKVPRADGILANSLRSSLYGTASMSQIGEASHTLVVGGMQAGDVARFEWTAPYARRMHYGFTGTDSLGRSYNQPGWYWVDEAVLHWQAIVDDVVRRVAAL